jgi:orotate phosphoribosyltransferase
MFMKAYFLSLGSLKSLMFKEELIVSLYKIGFLKFGRFTLTSGRKSNYYIDTRIIPSFPDVYSSAVKCFTELLKQHREKGFDCVAGIATGGLLFSIPASINMSFPMCYVREEVKEHGTRKRVEGKIKNMSKIVLIDDVATSGRSISDAARVISEEGGNTVMACVFIDRNEGAVDNLERIGIPLYSCFTSYEIFEVLFKRGLITKQMLSKAGHIL